MCNQWGIIPALDLDIKSVASLVTSLAKEESIAWYKIGSILVMEHGLKTVIETIRASDETKPLMLDMQKGATDIPYIVQKQIEVARRFGVDALIGAPLGAGSNRSPNGTLETFVECCNKQSVIPVVVLAMTQPGADYFLKNEAFRLIAELVCQLEVPYVVLPANNPDRIHSFRTIAKDQCVKTSVISPGVGPQKTGDPILDAVEAIKAGADYLVIGRAIYTSNDPPRLVNILSCKIAEAHEQRGRKF